MENLLNELAKCIEEGKVDKNSPFPPALKGKNGASELTQQALEKNIDPQKILSEGLTVGMVKIGQKFKENKVFVPNVLMSAKAMNKALEHLKPFFTSGKIKNKGKFIIGTVSGDLHDIGKNLVAMIVQGNGWDIIDLGVDVSGDKFINAIKENPGSFVGISALLTTTMMNMEPIIKQIKENSPQTKIIVGGAPLTENFSKKIGADFFSPDAQGATEYLNAAIN